jgi:cell division protein FtsB
VALLKSDKLDPDMLDEQARALLDYTDARDLTFMLVWKPVQVSVPAKP